MISKWTLPRPTTRPAGSVVLAGNAQPATGMLPAGQSGGGQVPAGQPTTGQVGQMSVAPTGIVPGQPAVGQMPAGQPTMGGITDVPASPGAQPSPGGQGQSNLQQAPGVPQPSGLQPASAGGLAAMVQSPDARAAQQAKLAQMLIALRSS